MKIEKGRNNSILRSTLEFGIAAMMIVQCRTMWMHLHDYGMLINRLCFVVLALCLIGLIIATNPGENIIMKIFFRERRQYLIILGIILFAAVFIYVNPINAARVVRCGIIVALMMVLVDSDSDGSGTIRILTRYSDLITWIAAVTLLFWFTFSVFKLIPPCCTIVETDWSESLDVVERGTFLNIYYETQWLVWGLARNTGIFTEAPMASFNYSLAFILDILVLKRIDRKCIAILVLAIITTFSTTGYLVVFMLAGYMAIFGSGWYRSKHDTAKRWLIVLAALTTFLMGWYLWIKIRWGSGNIRINDFIVGFQAWLANPVCGGGFENLEYLQSFMPGWREMNYGYSNSPLQVLAQGGLYMAVPYIACHIIGVRNGIRNHDYSLLMFILLLMVLTILTAVPYQYCLFYMLLVLAYSNRIFTNKSDSSNPVTDIGD